MRQVVTYLNLPPIEYDGRGVPKVSPLEPNHTHFILVDDGGKRADKWAGEIEVRNKVEARLAEMHKVQDTCLTLCLHPLGCLHPHACGAPYLHRCSGPRAGDAALPS